MKTMVVRRPGIVVPQILQRDALAKYKADPDYLYRRGSAQFQKWLALFFIEKGNYKITNKGYEELSASLRRMDTVFGESCSERERSGKEEVIRKMSKKESRVAVNEIVSRMLEEGKAGELYTKGQITYMADWKNDGVVTSVLRKFVETLGIERKKITKKEFKENNLEGLLVNKRFNGSVYLALVMAGYAYSRKEALEHAMTGNFQTEKIYPWELGRTPQHYHQSRENRVAVIKWLVWKVRQETIKVCDDIYKVRDIRSIGEKDFGKYGLGGLLVRPEYYGSSHAALVEAGYAYSMEEALEHARTGNFQTEKSYPWEMKKMSQGFRDETENRVAAIKWLVWKEGNCRGLDVPAFERYGLNGLLQYYRGSPHAALVEAGYAYSRKEALEHAMTGNFQTEKIYPWEMKYSPNGICKIKESRIAATRWLAWLLKDTKPPEEIDREDFRRNGLSGVLPYTEYDATVALIEAGILPEPTTQVPLPNYQNGVATL